MTFYPIGANWSALVLDLPGRESLRCDVRCCGYDGFGQRLLGVHMTTKYGWLPIEEDEEGSYITLPDELVRELGLKPGDERCWTNEKSGCWMLSKGQKADGTQKEYSDEKPDPVSDRLRNAQSKPDSEKIHEIILDDPVFDALTQMLQKPVPENVRQRQRSTLDTPMLWTDTFSAKTKA